MTAAYDATRQAARDLAEALTYFADAEQRLHDSNPAFPGAASYDGPGGRSANTDTHPERHALNPDPTQFDRDALARLTRNVSRDCRDLRFLIDAWKGGKTPTTKQRAEVERANAPADDCEHHTAMISKHENAAHTGTVSGNLPLPMRLCTHCYDQVRKRGKLPTAEALDARHRSGKNARERVA